MVALVERGGKARVRHMRTVNASNIREFMLGNADPASRLHNNESRLYPVLGAEFASHETVNHSGKQFVRGYVHVNSAEGFFGVLKREMTGVYQHCSEEHLQRYMDEFSFRHCHRVKLGIEDAERAEAA
jgi:hypothetical protein